MKKLITIGLICLVFFVSLAALSNNPQFSMIQNQSNSVRVNLTHQAQHIYTIDYFDIPNSQYIGTEGNNTLRLHGTETFPGVYPADSSFTDDTNGTSPPTGWTGDGIIFNQVTTHANITGLPEQIYQSYADQITGTVEMWLWIPSYVVAEHTLTFFATDSDEGGDQGVYIEFRFGGTPQNLRDQIRVWNYTTFGGANTFMAPLIHEAWFHIQIDFNCTSASYTVTYNNTLYGPYYYESGYEAAHVSMTKFEAVGALYSYIDAVDYSWADDYYLNRNMNTEILYGVEGTYKGLYSFTNIVNGANPDPASWVVVEDTGATVNVIMAQAEHTKVMEQYDPGAGYVLATQTFVAGTQTTGTIEFWIQANKTCNNVFTVRSDATEGVLLYFRWEVGHLDLESYYDASFHDLADIALNTWYHIRLAFNCTSDTFDTWLDGTPLEQSSFSTALTTANNIRFYWNGAEASYCYVDAMDYSWADGYYLNRNMDTESTELASYISPVLDLGEYNNYFVQYVNLSYLTPSDSDLTAFAQFSADNSTWSGWLPLIGLPNVSVGIELGRYAQFYFNLTSSTDFLETPELSSLLVQFEETVLNEYPSFADIAPANNSIGLNPDVPINCTILDADADLLNISLYVNDTLINSASNCDNGSLYYYLFHGNYSTTYAFYFELTDGENTTTSDLYLCTTGDEPEEEEPTIQTATVDDLFIAIGAVGFVLLTAAANIRKRRL